MRKTLSALLFAVLISTGCKKSQPEPVASVDLSSLDDSPSLRSADRPDDGKDESGGTGTAMALEEGKLGRKDAERAEGQYKVQRVQQDPQLARQQAIEQARSAGILGNASGQFAMARISSGFDTANLYGAQDRATAEAYHDWGKNPWTDATKDHLSTFAADVDTASYTIARRKLTEGTLPPPASVRVEEFVNYFKYAFPRPAANTPFAVILQAAPSPLQPGREIVRVGVATQAKSLAERKPAHLVFLVDVSGSMSSPDKLELAKKALRILTNNLKDGDTVSLVTYAGDTRVVLQPTGLEHKGQILDAIASLDAGGSTGMASGIDLAYQQAMAGLRPGTISRVIVCTDGDANVGAHTHEEILGIIAGRAKEGVTLSTIGFGMGNYKDELMEQLADKGNGNNFYIDSESAAKRVFQEQLTANLEVVAKDVKLQVDFDPAMVARYRLVGYENRDVADNDFRNDRVDAGEVGAGHQVTALYELELTAKGKQANAPLATVRIRHKAPNGEKATEAGFPMVGGPASSFEAAPADFRFAFAVAAFADVLRGGQDAEHWSLGQIRALAEASAGVDTDRRELLGLIDKAMTIRGRTASR